MVKNDALLVNCVKRFVRLKQSALNQKKGQTEQEEPLNLILMLSNASTVASVKKLALSTLSLRQIYLNIT